MNKSGGCGLNGEQMMKNVFPHEKRSFSQVQ